MARHDSPRLAVAPEGAPPWLTEAVEEGGGHVVGLAEAEGLIWGDPRRSDGLREALEHGANIGWVQLPFAGVERFRDLLDHDHVWVCGKGVYAEPVAELALTLGLAGLRGFGTFARASSWGDARGDNLLGARVTILGGGGITESLVRMLGPFGCHITVVRRTARDMPGVDDVLEADRYADALPGADLVVLALALTPETEGIIAAEELALMEQHAWVVNVARGGHIVTDDLVAALRRRRDRRRRARCHRSRTTAARAPAVVVRELHHHAARRQHARDGQAAAVRAHRRQRAPIRGGRGAARSRRRRRRLLTTVTGSVEGISHYDVLGVPATATATEIREAYRRAARRHHPDQAATAAGGDEAPVGAMSAINEAYRVLRDPARRAVYDAQLRGTNRSAVPPATRAAAPAPQMPSAAHVVFDQAGPVRYPWKLVLAMAALGIAVVLTGAALARPSKTPPPDNILQTGSCVEIEYTGDAREVNCTGTGDLVVRTIVPFDASCPLGTSAHRDRQGLGNACIEASAPVGGE